jgi:hypothetical protein
MSMKHRLRLWVALSFYLTAFGTGAVLLFLNSARAPRIVPALIFFACPALHLALFGVRDPNSSATIVKSKFDAH